MARYGPAVVPHLARSRRSARAGLTVISGFLLAFFVYANFSRAPHTGEMTHDESSAPPGTLDQC